MEERALTGNAGAAPARLEREGASRVMEMERQGQAVRQPLIPLNWAPIWAG